MSRISPHFARCRASVDRRDKGAQDKRSEQCWELERNTVAQLKKLCSEHGVNKAGTKTELVARLCDAMFMAESEVDEDEDDADDGDAYEEVEEEHKEEHEKAELKKEHEKADEEAKRRGMKKALAKRQQSDDTATRTTQTTSPRPRSRLLSR